MSTYQQIALDRIEPDPNQPRKHIDPREIDEMAASITTHGVITPITVRPHPTKNHGSFMIAWGEKRWLASKKAGKLDIPAIVDDALTDVEVLERQLIENSQRSDVPPLDEATAYDTLLKKHKYTMDQLVAKTGRSKAHLYGRLKLLELAPPVKKALQAGTLSVMVAELIARIPNAKLQEQAAREVLGQGDHRDYREGGVSPETITDDAEREEDAQPLSFRAAASHIRRKFATRLALASFSTADAELVAKAGACTTCPHRSGNQPELPGMGGGEAKAEDLCTNTSCFEAKTEAHWKQTAAAAKARGVEVVDQQAAKKYFEWNDQLAYDAPVATLETKLPAKYAKAGTTPTFGRLLGKELANVPKKLVQMPSGAPVEMLDKEAAIDHLRKLGKLDELTPKKSPADKAAAKLQREERDKAKAKHEVEERAFRMAIDKLVAGAEGMSDKQETAFLRLIAREFIESISYGADGLIVSRRGLKNLHELKALPEKAKNAAELRGVILEVLITDMQDTLIGGYARSEHKAMFADACKLFGVDMAKVRAAAKESVKVEDKADEVAEKKKAKKRGGAK